ncbi:hypothetical protein C8R43DRAFT_969357 [Mycena crocata]|nr:hypothetical protein C8R43DRAFT_969357 [Mycena crocata]
MFRPAPHVNITGSPFYDVHADVNGPKSGNPPTHARADPRSWIAGLPPANHSENGPGTNLMTVPYPIDSRSGAVRFPSISVPETYQSRPVNAYIGYDSLDTSTMPNVVYPQASANISRSSFVGSSVQQYFDKGLQILHASIAADAVHNSEERPKCHPETRTSLLHDLKNWATQFDARRVCFLLGPAAVGKSAVAQTLCQELKSEGRLGASFFFKKGHASCGNARQLFCTISYQLATLLPYFKRIVASRVEGAPSIVDQDMRMQMHGLVMDPFDHNNAAFPLIIIIDGLDECEGSDVQQQILHCIGDALRDYPSPLRFLITSRPEPHIIKICEDRESSLQEMYARFNVKQSVLDVRRYLQSEFTRINRQHQASMGNLPMPWPSSKLLESCTYFIYASTIIKFVDDTNFRPNDRLAMLEGLPTVDSESPLAALDQLYSRILTTIPPRPHLLSILHVISSPYLASLAPHEIEQLFNLQPGHVRSTLHGLQSVLRMPATNRPTESISVHHSSFIDFLAHPARSGRFHVGIPHATHVAQCILRLLSPEYDTLRDSMTRNDERHVAWKLCDYRTSWIRYITSLPPSAALVPQIRSVKPCFVFYYRLDADPPPEPNWHHTSSVAMLCWLDEIRPPPRDLILIWQDYRAMHFFELDTRLCWPTCETPLQDCTRELAESPGLLRVLQNWVLLENGRRPTIFEIKFLLDLSWDGLRIMLTSLISLVEEDAPKRDGMFMFMRNSQLCGTLYPGPGTSLELARACLRVLEKIRTKELPSNFW